MPTFSYRAVRRAGALALVAPFAVGQGSVAPPIQGMANPVPGISPPALPGTGIRQIHMIHLATLPNHIAACGATCTGLPINWGGDGGIDVLCGTYDVLSDTFTPNGDAANLNTSDIELGLTLHHTGLYAAFDRIPGTPRLATRSSVSQPWIDFAPITPLPVQQFHHPALADRDGQTWLLHVQGRNIAMTPISLTTGTLVGPSQVVARPAQAAGSLHSPAPILDTNGQLLGVSYHESVSIPGSHYFSFDLDPATPGLLLYASGSRLGNGGYFGGRFFDAEYGATQHIRAFDTFWWTGGRTGIGTSMVVSFMSPPSAGAPSHFSVLVASSAFLPVGQPLPGISGALGLTATGILSTPPVPHEEARGVADFSIPVPNVPALRGTRVPAQSVTYAAAQNQVWLGNTAFLEVR